MSSQTIILLISQVFCSVFVVYFLLKIVPSRESELNKSNVDLKAENSKLINQTNELSERILILSTEFAITSDLNENQDTEISSFKNQMQSSRAQIISLQNELKEKQRYLNNCWDKIKLLEKTLGVNSATKQPSAPKNSDYNNCKACDRSIEYCICAG